MEFLKNPAEKCWRAESLKIASPAPIRRRFTVQPQKSSHRFESSGNSEFNCGDWLLQP
jgi:hypothetical protein